MRPVWMLIGILLITAYAAYPAKEAKTCKKTICSVYRGKAKKACVRRCRKAVKGTCQPFTSSCATQSSADFYAEGGKACISGTTIDLGFGSSLIAGYTNRLIIHPVLYLDFRDGEVLKLPDNSIVMEKPAGDDAVIAVCWGQIVPAIRTLYESVKIRQVCGVGATVVGSFDVVFQLATGATCSTHGEFTMFRTQ